MVHPCKSARTRSPDARHILIVEPDRTFRIALSRCVPSGTEIEAVADFQTARARLIAEPPDLLVTNWRLCAFNGLHLVYLLASLRAGARAVVYSEFPDVSLMMDARDVGALCELRHHLPRGLPAYLEANLPSCDRRDLRWTDRRRAFRGGRRSVDETEAAGIRAKRSADPD